MACSSSNLTEVMFAFPTSGMKRGSRVVAYMVFPNCLTALVCLLISGGEGRSSENLYLLGPPLIRRLVESLC